MEYVTYLIFLGFATDALGRDELQIMSVNHTKGLKFEYMGVYFPIDRLEHSSSLDFFNVLLKDKPDVILHKCHEEHGWIEFRIGAYISMVYVVMFDEYVDRTIKYLGGVFTEVSSIVTLHFVANVRSHKPGSGPSYIMVDSVARRKLVVFAKTQLDLDIQESVDYVMMSDFSQLTLGRYESLSELKVTPFSECRNLSSAELFRNRYDFTTAKISRLKNISEFYLHLSGPNNLSIDTKRIHYGRWNLLRAGKELIVAGFELLSTEDCDNKITVSSCAFFLIKYQTFFERWCIFKLLRIDPTMKHVYPCMIQVALRSSDGNVTTLESMVPYDYAAHYKPTCQDELNCDEFT